MPQGRVVTLRRQPRDDPTIGHQVAILSCLLTITLPASVVALRSLAREEATYGLADVLVAGGAPRGALALFGHALHAMHRALERAREHADVGDRQRALHLGGIGGGTRGQRR